MKLSFEVQENNEHDIVFFTNAEGNVLFRSPLLNKGTAFSEEERNTFGLKGLIPPKVLTLEQQIEKVHRRYHRLGITLDLYKSCPNISQDAFITLKKEIDIARYNFLRDLQDRNEILFYAYAFRYLEDIIPIVYTPTVGDAVLRYSRDSARFRGIFFSPSSIDKASTVYDRFRFAGPTIAVVTDNQGILGLGDQGIGGMNIPIGKLALYVLGAGIRPWETIPISLDVGTNNIEDLQDPYYLGHKAGRLQGDDYFQFIDTFVTSTKEKFPHILLQWEDFSRQNAFTLLDKYRNKVLSFNDDIQGTGSVALAGILNGLKVNNQDLAEQRFVIYGAGAGGIGIARRLEACLVAKYHFSKSKASKQIIVIDSKGVVTDQRPVQDYKKQFAVTKQTYQKWDIDDESHITLLESIRNFRPTVLIGTSGKHGHFTREVLQAMADNTEHPIIFPLSNPTSNSEATPYDIYRYTKGKARVATGSPFTEVSYKGDTVTIGQGNNFFVFPGVGLGAILSQGEFINDDVFTEVAITLSALTPQKLIDQGILYPSFSNIRTISARIAHTTIQQIAQEQGTPEMTLADIKNYMWKPGYHPIYKKE